MTRRRLVALLVIRNLEVRRYDSPAQRGASDGFRSRGWHLDRVSAIDNHGEGIGIGSGMLVASTPAPLPPTCWATHQSSSARGRSTRIRQQQTAQP